MARATNRPIAVLLALGVMTGLAGCADDKALSQAAATPAAVSRALEAACTSFESRASNLDLDGLHIEQVRLADDIESIQAGSQRESASLDALAKEYRALAAADPVADESIAAHVRTLNRVANDLDAPTCAVEMRLKSVVVQSAGSVVADPRRLLWFCMARFGEPPAAPSFDDFAPAFAAAGVRLADALAPPDDDYWLAVDAPSVRQGEILAAALAPVAAEGMFGPLEVRRSGRSVAVLQPEHGPLEVSGGQVAEDVAALRRCTKGFEQVDG